MENAKALIMEAIRRLFECGKRMEICEICGEFESPRVEAIEEMSWLSALFFSPYIHISIHERDFESIEAFWALL